MKRYDSDDYSYWPRYVPVAEKRAKAAKQLEKLKQKKGDVQPVVIQGNRIAASWWGKAWCSNLENYADYSNRIARGKSYVRHGCVLDLRIESGLVKALVQGSQKKPYEISIKIDTMTEKDARTVTDACAGQIESLQELVEGKFPKELETLFKAKGSGLFPSPHEIHFNCSCPDWASMCKHVAAVLYGIGARFDIAPTLFFTLRGIDADALIGKAIANKTTQMLKDSDRKTARVLKDDDLGAVFGIEMDDRRDVVAVESVEKKTRKSGEKDDLAKEKRTGKKATLPSVKPVQRKKVSKSELTKKGKPGVSRKSTDD
jgi:uncharacterized Zn finger protein